MAKHDSDRERVLALLEAQHTFPGTFRFRVVVRPAVRSTILSVMGAAAPGGLIDVTERPSRTGAYVALHLLVAVDRAEEVLGVYDVLARVDGVLAVM